MVGVPESPVSAVSCDAENTLLSVSRFARLILCRNLQISDFSEMRRKITLSSEPTDGSTASLIGSDIFQRHIFILILDVDESRVWLVEGAATRVLAGRANWNSGFYRTGEGESFGHAVVDGPLVWARSASRPSPREPRSPPTSTCSI